MMKNKHISDMSLEQAVEATLDVRGGYRKGLGAIKASYKGKINVLDTRKIGGSLDIDTTTKYKYPHDNRWDYALEYNKETFFLEFHPGNADQVDIVIKKKEWLNHWLENNAPKIKALKAKNKQAYFWIYTNKSYIVQGSKETRKLSQKGIAYIKSISLK